MARSRITPQQWQAYATVLRELYLDQKLSFAQIIVRMQQQGLVTTKAQLMRGLQLLGLRRPRASRFRGQQQYERQVMDILFPTYVNVPDSEAVSASTDQILT